MTDASGSPRRIGGLLAVSAVFFLGAICGAAIFFAGSRLLPAPPPFGQHAGRRGGRPPIARMAGDLDLDETQQQEVRAVFDRTRKQIDEILEKGRVEIRGLLRPDQQSKFDRMRPPRPPMPPGPPPPPGPPGEEPPEPR